MRESIVGPSMARRSALQLLGTVSLGTLLAVPAVAQSAAAATERKASSLASDTLAEAFRDPPKEARPRVWWHWVNGNITQKGIEEDLAWLTRIGVAGVQNFDASVDAPHVVDRPLAYMSPEWKEAFRLAVSRADALGLEYGIPASPGWSETGGPWVNADDAMKKLV